jgi:hypothetical protein
VVSAAELEPTAVPAELTARRAHWYLACNLATALAMLAVALLNIGYQLRNGGPAWVAVALAAMVGFYAWQAVRQLLDRQPIVVVRADGLLLPTASAAPIAWARIRDVARGGLLARNQIEIALDAATAGALTLGQRALGDSVIKRRGVDPGLAIRAGNLDQPAAAIIAAILRHWPPPAAN